MAEPWWMRWLAAADGGGVEWRGGGREDGGGDEWCGNGDGVGGEEKGGEGVGCGDSRGGIGGWCGRQKNRKRGRRCMCGG
ncbi:hypothetical protein Tco_1374446 [Tanacetum coccineum]